MKAISYHKYQGEELEADKRFLCFAFCEFYPSGGLGDVAKDFDDLESAIRFVKNDMNEYKYVYDRLEGKAVELDDYSDQH